MTEGFRSPGLSQERLLLTGPFGSGKTTAYLSIAKWAIETGSDARFYVLDSDRAVNHLLSTPTWSKYSAPFTVYEVYDFPDFTGALEQVRPQVRPHDWTIVDFMDAAWPAAQDHYTNEIYDRSLANYFLDMKKRGKDGNPLDGWKDWSVINKIYGDFAKTLFYGTASNVLVTAKSKALSDTDSKQLRAEFGGHGIRPAGQKDLAFQVHTVLYMQNAGTQGWYMNTVKDRGRTYHQGTQLTDDYDFAMAYLMGTAGWVM